MNPYRLFFPLGWIFAILGSVSWVAFAFIPGSPYVANLHAELMVGGFILLYVVGFLMTAIPRFTRSDYATSGELAIAGWLGFQLLVFHLLDHRLIFQISILLLFVFLSFYAVRRFLNRQSSPPGFFLFIPIGLVCGGVGALGLAANTLGWDWSPHLTLSGSRNLLFRAMPLALILGVGARLVPGILGWSELPQHARPNAQASSRPRMVIPPLVWFLALSFVAGAVIKMWGTTWSFYLGQSLWMITFTGIGWRFWRLHRKPPQGSFFKYSVLLAGWGIWLGEFALIFLPTYKVHLEHLTFLLGFGLMTFMVSSRVTVAHSPLGLGSGYEKKRIPYLLLGGLTLLAALTRVSAVFIPNFYASHLGYAAIVWIATCLVWGWLFLTFIFGWKGNR